MTSWSNVEFQMFFFIFALRIAKAYWFYFFWYRFYWVNWILIFFDNFGHLTWLWRHHKNFDNNWFLPLLAPGSDFLTTKMIFPKVKLKRYRMMYHMTTLDDFRGKWSFWPLIAKNGRSFYHESRISFQCLFLSSRDHVLSFDTPFAKDFDMNKLFL